MMQAKMEKTYDPKQVEDKWYAFWMEHNLFHGDSARGGEPYCVAIPPPNVTGILHMGHALNNTLQDILVRWRRMQGRNVVWMPGTDHAGIATQNVVERALAQEGKSREDLGRDAFIERVWAWREQYGSTIINQLKKLGSSCDWERERFTMDKGLSKAVEEVFVRLYDKGLIHRANYIINWCPRCQTALSDEESEHQPTQGSLYYIRYPVVKQGAALPDSSDAHPPAAYVVVATTRPETLLGDVALAVNPQDERYRDLGGQRILLPVLGRELKVIHDDYVDKEFGTGIVKVTPAHDPNDFEMGRRHGLTPINVMHGDGRMNEEAGPYAGLDRFECRKRLLADLKERGLIEKIDAHDHAVGHCYRCDTVVEPRLSPQWFVKMKPLAEPAIEAVRNGRIEFVPARWTKVYLEWLDNIRDWCISRQIWWGHRIPVFNCQACGKEWAATGRPQACPECGANRIEQDPDVLDTWFSSWLWPFSTFGWPEENADLKFYYPTHDLATASEIIFFWVARMVMAGCEFMGDIPFSKVYIHGTVRADDGRKMSKSLGNSIDPLTIIEKYSADALRFSLMMITATGQDIYVSDKKFEIGRNFATKLWNAARFIQMHSAELSVSTEAPQCDAAQLRSDDKHLLAKLQEVIRDCTGNLEKYRFNDTALALYEFVWHRFCDWYVEYAKDDLYGENTPRRELTLQILHHAFSVSLRLLHPLMPFITEELWHAMGYGSENESIMLAPWPEAVPAERLAEQGITPEWIDYVEQKHELIRIGRTLRADYGIAPTQRVRYMIRPNGAADAERLSADLVALKTLLHAEEVMIDTGPAPEKAMPTGVSVLGNIYMPLAGLIDIENEIKRLTGQLEKLDQDLKRTTAKLENETFVGRAPADVVEKQRIRRQELIESDEKLRGLIATLSGM